MKTLQMISIANMARVLLISAMFFFSSCYSYRIATHAQAGTEFSKPVMANSYFWGLLQNPRDGIHTPDCDELGVNGVAVVEVKSNFLFSLVTVCTLGIWSPLKVVYQCSKPCQPTGNL
jgi:Bor protein